MPQIEIYYRDLTPEAQTRLLEAFKTSVEEENWEVFPLAVIERENDQDSLSVDP